MIIMILIQLLLSLYGVTMLFIVMCVKFNPTIQLPMKRNVVFITGWSTRLIITWEVQTNPGRGINFSRTRLKHAATILRTVAV